MKRLIVPAIALGLVPLYAYSQGQATYKPEVKVEIKDGYRFLSANGIPDHPTGHFPSRGNPNAISPQDYHFRIPLTPKPQPGQPARGAAFGVAINGVVFDPGTAETWNGDMRWHYEALSGLMGSRGKMGADGLKLLGKTELPR